MKITIFFSWQARTKGKYNRFFILECLKQILPFLETVPDFKGIKFELLEGISGESGSVQLASKIMDDRIPRSDIFIADLTNINGEIPDFIPAEKRDEYKTLIQPTPNPNVLLEYGNAYQVLGEEKIISIVNEYFGSLKDYENLLPFDIRHLRFPLSYNYSEDNKDDKLKVEKKLIKQLADAIETTSRFHLQTLKSKFRPFKTWNDWNDDFDCSQQFQNNQFISDFINDIQNTVSNSYTSIRIIGLSGLGKSRILLETFRPIDSDPNSLLLSSRILYYDFQEKSTLDLSQYLNSLQEKDENRIIILDNCSLEDHRKLLKYISKPNNKLSLITIDSNPEELERNKIAKIKYIEIKKENLDDVVEKIIDNDFSHLSEEHTKKIKDFIIPPENRTAV
ncbi:hypothetical protein [Parapedobacter sp. 10938]|uniref:hypothetical protein n=1 Tax=Parapedobacter flavus TaxID=3110225 RepID=UPI002DB899BD|nr:hypothetical protein [Parapedobacter sp. 10938]MEC3879589.1 hypothetical protein [Parapedobacter sp. 10938]